MFKKKNSISVLEYYAAEPFSTITILLAAFVCWNMSIARRNMKVHTHTHTHNDQNYQK